VSRPGPQPSKKDRLAAAREHAAQLRAEEQRKRRRRLAIIWSSSGVVVLAAAVAVVLGVTAATAGASAPTKTGTLTGVKGPETIPIEAGTVLAPDTTSSTGATTDGIACNAGEGTAEHIHTHLSVYVNGTMRPIPLGIGIVQPEVETQDVNTAMAGASKCFYWLHVHAQDGIIHVEAPTKNPYTLGQFFAVWGQKLSSTTVAGATGKQTVYVNGKIVTGDPTDIQLASHEDIQIDVGKVVPYQKVDWTGSGL
jgi:hypothetical protein